MNNDIEQSTKQHIEYEKKASKRHSRMYYIWCDESDKEGPFYSNFYGGILIRSMDLPIVLNRMESKMAELGITEEVKWQKVNKFVFDKYKSLVDFIFDLLEEDLIKIRIFFRHNQYVPSYLTKDQMREEYSLLYYQFIKHAFGLAYSNPTDKSIGVRIALDEMPITQEEKTKFKNFLVRLSEDKAYQEAKIRIKEEDVIEVNSKKHLPLQMMDLILGAICFRLNDKHKEKLPGTRKRGVRTIKKEQLYKHIYFRLSRLRKGFNVGKSTGFSNRIEIWTQSYRHWSFVPKGKTIDKHLTKSYQREHK